eukprot:ANDGO_01365.mRNA.1 hypothetical protein
MTDADLLDFRAKVFPALAFLNVLCGLGAAVFFAMRTRQSYAVMPGVFTDARTVSLLILSILSLFFSFIGIFSAVMILSLLVSMVSVLGVHVALAPRKPHAYLVFGLSLLAVLLISGYSPLQAPTAVNPLSIQKGDCENYYGNKVDQDKRCADSLLSYVRVGGTFVLFFMIYTAYCAFSVATSAEYSIPVELGLSSQWARESMNTAVAAWAGAQAAAQPHTVTAVSSSAPAQQSQNAYQAVP